MCVGHKLKQGELKQGEPQGHDLEPRLKGGKTAKDKMQITQEHKRAAGMKLAEVCVSPDSPLPCGCTRDH